jgi:hypothetical protein
MKILNVVKSFLVAIIISVFAIPAYAENVNVKTVKTITGLTEDEKIMSDKMIGWIKNWNDQDPKRAVTETNDLLKFFYEKSELFAESRPRYSRYLYNVFNIIISRPEVLAMEGIKDPRTKEVIVASLL